MKTIYLPYTLGRAVKAICYIFAAVLDILHFILAPIAMLRFKAHVFMLSLAGLGYVYLNFVAHHEKAMLVAALSFCAATITIALVKFIRKQIKHLRCNLMHIVYAPVGVSFNVYTFKRNHTTQLATVKI